MALLQLPNELLLQIGEQLSLLPKCSHISALLRTNRRLAELLQPVLDKIAVPVDLGRRKRVLHWASERGYERLAGALLENGSYVGALDCNGWTPLLHAAANGHSGIIRKLLGKGANIEAKSYWGDRETALHCAVLRGQESAVRVLLERGAEVDPKAQSRSTALHFAIGCEEVMITKLLIDKGANVNIQKDNEVGNYAIHLAVQGDDEQILRLLLENGANLTAQNRLGNTALHLATSDNCPSEMMKLLLERGADFTVRNQRGETPLHIATTHNNTEAVFRMLRMGAAIVINAQDADGNTPLLCVAAGSDPIDVKKTNSNRLSRHRSFERLAHRRNTELVHDVRAASVAMETTKNDIIKMLLENGANVNHQGKRRQTALHLTAANGYEEMAMILIENGAKTTLKDENGCTALELVGEYVQKYREGGAAGRGTVLGLKQLLGSESSLNKRESVQGSPGLRGLKTGMGRRESIQVSPGGLRDPRSPPPIRPLSVNEMSLHKRMSKRTGPGIRFPIRVVQRVNSLGNLSET